MRGAFLLKWIVLTAAVILCPIILEYGFSYSLEPALQAGFFVILSVSLALVVGLTGQISLGHAAFFGIGAYGAAILATRGNLPVVLAIPAGTLVGLAAGFLIGYPVLRLKSYYLALATLVIGIAVQEFFKAADFLTGGEIGLYDLPDIKLGSFELSSAFSHYYVVWMFALIIVFFCDRLSKSFLGKRLRAIHSDEGAAESAGIDVPRMKLGIFTFSAAIAAFAGTLFAHCSYGTIAPGEFGVVLSIKIITMVVIGGMFSVYGAAMGAVIIALLPEMIRRLGDLAHMDLTQITHLQDIAFGVILVIFVIFAPQGLIGKMRMSRTNA